MGAANQPDEIITSEHRNIKNQPEPFRIRNKAVLPHKKNMDFVINGSMYDIEDDYKAKMTPHNG